MSQSNRERLHEAQDAAAKQRRLSRIIGVGAAVLTVVALVVVGIMVVRQTETNQTPPASSPITPPDATKDGKAIALFPDKAKQGAPVVELFFDYQCPVCNQFDALYGSSLKSLAESGEISLHYRNLTFLDQNLNNDASLRAGVGAACADVVGLYSAYHDEVYANQPESEGNGYTDDALRATIPAAAGITGDKLTTFQSCYDSQATNAFVNGTNELGQKDLLKVNQQVSTPTVHVNGKDLPLKSLSGAKTPTEVYQAIQKVA